jgi:rhodanese-related sulfurtransferase
MKKIAYITICCLLAGLPACQNQGGKSTDQQSSGSAKQINTTIPVEEFEKKLGGNVQLIDVRTPQEFEQGHLKGALNLNIRSEDFETKLAALDKSKPVLVYCLSGGRSSSAAELMEKKGFSEVYNMKGGIMKWNAANKPVENSAGAPASEGLSSEAFNHLLKSDKYVLVDYNAKWCKPCQRMAPLLDAYADKNKDKLVLLKIDADQNKALLTEKGIESTPVLELYKNEKLIWKHEGEMTEADLAAEIKL